MCRGTSVPSQVVREWQSGSWMAGRGSFLNTSQKKEMAVVKIMLFLFSGAISDKVIKMRNFLKNIYSNRKTLGDCFSRSISSLLLLLILQLKNQNIYINSKQICETWKVQQNSFFKSERKHYYYNSESIPCWQNASW